MPIRTNDNIVFLEADCPIEEAEELHEILRGIEAPLFDLSKTTYLHTAIIQLIMLSAGSVRGLKPDPVLTACFRERIAS
jgi:hypothetical protein